MSTNEDGNDLGQTMELPRSSNSESNHDTQVNPEFDDVNEPIHSPLETWRLFSVEFQKLVDEVKRGRKMEKYQQKEILSLMADRQRLQNESKIQSQEVHTLRQSCSEATSQLEANHGMYESKIASIEQMHETEMASQLLLIDTLHDDIRDLSDTLGTRQVEITKLYTQLSKESEFRHQLIHSEKELGRLAASCSEDNRTLSSKLNALESDMIVAQADNDKMEQEYKAIRFQMLQAQQQSKYYLTKVETWRSRFQDMRIREESATLNCGKCEECEGLDLEGVNNEVKQLRDALDKSLSLSADQATQISVLADKLAIWQSDAVSTSKLDSSPISSQDTTQANCNISESSTRDELLIALKKVTADKHHISSKYKDTEVSLQETEKEYSERIQQYQSAIESSSSENKNLQDELEQAERLASKLKIEKQQLCDQINRNQNIIRSRDEEMERHAAEQNEMDKVIAKQSTSIESLKKKLADNAETVTRKSVEIDKLRAKMTASQTKEIEVLKQASEIEDLKEALATQEFICEKEKTKIVRLRKAVKLGERKMRKVQEDAEAQKLSLLNTIKNLELMLQNLRENRPSQEQHHKKSSPYDLPSFPEASSTKSGRQSRGKLGIKKNGSKPGKKARICEEANTIKYFRRDDLCAPEADDSSQQSCTTLTVKEKVHSNTSAKSNQAPKEKTTGVPEELPSESLTKSQEQELDPKIKETKSAESEYEDVKMSKDQDTLTKDTTVATVDPTKQTVDAANNNTSDVKHLSPVEDPIDIVESEPLSTVNIADSSNLKERLEREARDLAESTASPKATTQTSLKSENDQMQQAQANTDQCKFTKVNDASLATAEDSEMTKAKDCQHSTQTEKPLPPIQSTQLLQSSAGDDCEATSHSKSHSSLPEVPQVESHGERAMLESTPERHHQHNTTRMELDAKSAQSQKRSSDHTFSKSHRKAPKRLKAEIEASMSSSRPVSPEGPKFTYDLPESFPGEGSAEFSFKDFFDAMTEGEIRSKSVDFNVS